MNILSLLPAEGMKRVASTSGGEWAGPCPWCGGRDRFRVWPDHPSGDAGGRFLCRGCGRHGDGIDFLRERDGLGYVDACKALQVPPKPMERTRRSVAAPAWTPAVKELPSATWRAAAEAFISEAAGRMTAGSPGMAYAAIRNLTPETVAALRIGWNPEDAWQDREVWGLPPELKADGKPRKVWLPAGLVIPCRRKGGLAAVKVRRVPWTPGDRLPKYVAVAGSVPGLALAHAPGRPVVVVESELDAVLIWQEAGDVVSALALGSASARPDADAATFLRPAPRILVATDFDAAGMAAVPWWREHFPQSEPWPVPQGKDVGDLATVPGLVRQWIRAAFLKPAEPAKPALAWPAPEYPMSVGSISWRYACLAAIAATYGLGLVRTAGGGLDVTAPATTPPDAKRAALDGLSELTPYILARLRQPEPPAPGQIRCENCGRPFTPDNPDMTFCSAECFNHSRGWRQ